MSHQSYNRRLVRAMRDIVEDDAGATIVAVTISRDETGTPAQKVFFLANGSQLAHAALRILRQARPILAEACGHCRADGLIVEQAIALLLSMSQHTHEGAAP